ncbi:uncharacterized protein LOC111714534 [Eurytemora carolleeae]|uniref:uncharacterized protein LOC111714534 n=1 Tax=Eurytemora carolleeae TaxID=1294199 RepID=UPI000C77FAA0|nr:uncharacterized protein LOC111714534 [Eurytemora carolleeae]|eukprot:XP_023345435.1 uncharacterized protein LOC111714534 [Eurytemora affinis]
MIGNVSTILGFSLMMFLSSVEGRSTSMHSNPPRSGQNLLARERRQEPEIDLQTIVEVLAEMDGNDCGKRYLCEVGTIPQEMRNKQEKATMDLFQGKGVADSVEMAQFRSAANYGVVAKAPQLCVHRYKNCALGKQPVLQTLLAEGRDLDTNLV